MRTAAKHAVSTSWMISDRKSRSPKTDNNPEPGHGNDLSHAGTKFHCRLYRGDIASALSEALRLHSCIVLESPIATLQARILAKLPVLQPNVFCRRNSTSPVPRCTGDSGFRFIRSDQAAGSQNQTWGMVIAKRGAARHAERPAKRCVVALTGHRSILFR